MGKIRMEKIKEKRRTAALFVFYISFVKGKMSFCPGIKKTRN